MVSCLLRWLNTSIWSLVWGRGSEQSMSLSVSLIYDNITIVPATRVNNLCGLRNACVPLTGAFCTILVLQGLASLVDFPALHSICTLTCLFPKYFDPFSVYHRYFCLISLGWTITFSTLQGQYIFNIVSWRSLPKHNTAFLENAHFPRSPSILWRSLVIVVGHEGKCERVHTLSWKPELLL